MDKHLQQYPELKNIDPPWDKNRGVERSFDFVSALWVLLIADICVVGLFVVLAATAAAMVH